MMRLNINFLAVVSIMLLIDVFQFSFPLIQNFKQRPQKVTHCGYQYLIWPFLQGTPHGRMSQLNVGPVSSNKAILSYFQRAYFITKKLMTINFNEVIYNLSKLMLRLLNKISKDLQ